jgi:GT2 family glycosyltransferase
MAMTNTSCETPSVARSEPGTPARMLAEPRVSVVLVTWNRRADLRESLRRLLANGPPGQEVIVCDNASTDGTAAMLREEFPGVLAIDLPRNEGIGAYNAGLRRARGEFIVVLDDDSWPGPGAIGRMLERFAADSRLGIIAFDVRNAALAGVATVPASRAGLEQAPAYLMAFNGAGAGIRRAVLEEVGYYPEEFFLYWNEQDLSLRVLDAGWRIASFPDVVAYHRHSPVNRESWRAPFYYCRNAFWLVWKHYPLSRAVPLTIELGRLVARHSLEQRTTVYLRAACSAMRGALAIARARKPVGAEVAARFRLPLELGFTYFR